MDTRPIGLFDSGIGGLTVLNEYIKLFPNEDFIYYADTANLPYGSKTKTQIIEYSKKIVEFFISKNVKAIIIACGTASSQAYTYLKKHYDIPIFNIIEPVAKNLCCNNVGVIATEGSINSHVWEKEIMKYNHQAKITAVACPKLVPIAEEGLSDSLEAKLAIHEYLSTFKDKNIEALILGCTHYPLFSDLIQDELGTEINLINVGVYSAQDFKNYLNDFKNSDTNAGKVSYFASGDYEEFLAKTSKFKISL